jgi:hypothetical protein
MSKGPSPKLDQLRAMREARAAEKKPSAPTPKGPADGSKSPPVATIRRKKAVPRNK